MKAQVQMEFRCAEHVGVMAGCATCRFLVNVSHRLDALKTQRQQLLDQLGTRLRERTIIITEVK